MLNTKWGVVHNSLKIVFPQIDSRIIALIFQITEHKQFMLIRRFQVFYETQHKQFQEQRVAE